MPTIQNIFYYIAAVLVLSVASFLMYGWDKRQAKTGGWRVPEKNLHLLSLFGGWPGAILGQNYFRHKTQKQSFRGMFWLTVVLHVCGVVYLLYKGLPAIE